MQPANQNSSNLESSSGVDLWDSTLAAFPELPSPRIRRNSTGDVPAWSESNDDGSDLESVKSMQISSAHRTAWGHSLGTSSYASVVVGSTGLSNKEQCGASDSQSCSSIQQKSLNSDRDSGYDVSSSCLHSSDQSPSEEMVLASPTEVANISSSVIAGLDSSDFVVDSSIIHKDRSCTDQIVSSSDAHMSRLSATCSRASRRGHTMLFFDTRSKMSAVPVPSLDISFGFDDSLVSADVCSTTVPVTGDSQIVALSPQVALDEKASAVEFLQRSSFSHPSTGLRSTSTASLPRSLFDLRAAQKYLLGGEW